VLPIMAYSHNDEMQGENALALALSLGFSSIEIDLPLPGQDSTYQLVVGHRESDLNERSLAHTYLNPLLTTLNERNEGKNVSAGQWTGLYESRPRAQVQLVIDFKSHGEAMWPYLVSALEPLRTAGFLTTYHVESKRWSAGPLIVVGTGNAPLSEIYHAPHRDIFYDAPLMNLEEPVTIPASSARDEVTFQWTPDISPMASAKFPAMYHLGMELPPWSFIEKWLRGYTDEARRRGIKSRWWGTARMTQGIRKRLWMMISRGGADWLGGDDLPELAQWIRSS
ncbi:hypothetical protein BD324DRAFT_584166, partial [Kockovaella imperatae]